ncbi:hypothetical protein K2Q00_00450 [Patescibacteria group bacterium]|nr:hypothetical protein [Patescibacteria group bacterium]
MANPQLTAYIQENLSKFSKEAVIRSLSSAGWSAIDISAAFMELEHPAPVAPVAPPTPAPVPAQMQPVAIVIPPASAAPVVTQTKPLTQTAAAANPNDAFLAEMTKRRKEAEALNPQTPSQGGVTISIGSTQSPVVTQTGLIGMVMKTGLVKTQQQANMVLIGIIVVCLGLTAWFMLG